MIRRLAGYFLNPWFLALLFTLLLVLLIPFGKSKYLVQVDNLINRPGLWQDYHDLNHDGVLEKIYILSNNHYSSVVVSTKNSTIDQWNINGKFHDVPDFLSYGDITGDGKDEVFTFYERNDSLFLCCVNAYYEPGFHFNDLYIDRLNRAFNTAWYGLTQPRFYDSNHDGVPEMYFGLIGVFAIKPRNMYKVDFVSHTVTHIDLGYAHIDGFDFINMKDGQKEIVLTTSTSANIHNDSLPYNDRFTWLMAMDCNLRFAFPPVMVMPLYSENYAFRSRSPGTFVCLSLMSKDSGSRLVLSRYQWNGILINSVEYPMKVTYSFQEYIHYHNDSKIPFLVSDDMGKYFTIDTAFKLKFVAQLEPLLVLKSVFLFNNDTIPEYLFYSHKSKEWLITNENLKTILTIPFGNTVIDQPVFLAIHEKDRKHIKFSLTNIHLESMITCTHNPWYYWRFVIYILIYAALFALFNHLRHVWENQVRERMSAEKSMLHLQLSSLASQLDPHLTFNLLNNVSYILLKHNETEIHRSFTRLTSYIRNSLVKSGMLVITLREELEFTSAYLELQKALMKERLDWSITVTPEVPPEFRIPRMCLQNLVENAIKHGLRPKPEGGKVVIRIDKQNGKVFINVRDNGIGKGADSVLPESGSGKGLGILREFFALLNRINAEKASMSFEYLADEQGHPAGAESLIIIPVDYRYQ